MLITLARISAHYSLGLKAKVNLSDAQLFSETQGRYVIAVKAGQELNIEHAIEIGQPTDTDEFNVAAAHTSISKRASDIKAQWEGAIAQCLTTVD